MPRAAARTRLEVVVIDAGVDAAARIKHGSTLLILRPGQSHWAAVAAVQASLPLSLDEARALVRRHLPDAMDLDQVIGAAEHSDSPPPAQRPEQKRRGKIPLIAPLAGLAAITAAAGVAAVVLDVFAPTVQPTGVVAAIPPAGSTGGFHPDSGATFDVVAELVGIDCEPVARMRATCVDDDGSVSVGEVWVSEDAVQFDFSYGDDRVSMRVFTDEDDAQKFTEQAATRRVNDNLRREGRMAVWGTDVTKVEQYATLIEADQETRATAPPTAPADVTATITPAATATPTSPEASGPEPSALMPKPLTHLMLDTIGAPPEVTTMVAHNHVATLNLALFAGDFETAMGVGIIVGNADLVDQAAAALAKQTPDQPAPPPASDAPAPPTTPPSRDEDDNDDTEDAGGGEHNSLQVAPEPDGSATPTPTPTPANDSAEPELAETVTAVTAVTVTQEAG